MKKKLLYVAASFCLFASSYGQSPLWTKVSPERLRMYEKVERASQPQNFQLFSLDLPALKAKLEMAPMRSNAPSALVLSFPAPNGKIENYQIYESPVMEAELAAKYPGIKSYIGKGIDDPTATINFSVTLFGLHTMTLSGKTGTSYIDPYTKDLNNYIIYSKKDLQPNRAFSCMVQDDHEAVSGRLINSPETAMASDGKYRVYRLAMACTIEYAAYHVNAAGLSGGTTAQKKAAVLAAMNVTMTRVNGLYERDMSLHMNIVANNDLIIYIDSDNFTNSPQMINEIQPIVDAAIGAANYDIGHGVCTTDSGIAQLNSPCSANKARGITGQPNPVGDPFDIDYVAHEMGHQYGATHTQNNACNRTDATAVEPGSASTIMGYAGICAPNVQEHSDAHFHAVSIAQMQTFVNAGGNCAVTTNNGNAAPVVNAGANYTIPYGTAFILKGSATDTAGESLTYCWEQTNNQVSTQPPTATATTGPNFRSLPPSTSPNRYMPRFEDVLAGNLTPTWEVVPNVARTMNFALTVRDNRAPNGGQTGRGDMTVTFANTGPFRITSPATANVSWERGSSQTVTWDVAGTTANGINTANVNIKISMDNGATFTTLVANTPNDGSEVITVPNTAAPYCRIMVEAVGNIFYALSKNIAVGYTITNSCETFTNNTVSAIPDGPNPNTSTAGPTLTSNLNITAAQTLTDVNVNVNVTHQWIRDLITRLKHPDGTEVILASRICNDQDGFNINFNDGSPSIVCAAPITTGTFAPNQPLAALNGKPSNGNWQLLINDYFQGDTGNLNSWSVEVCYQTALLGTESFGLQDFAIFPNPNNGNFTISFKSASANEIKVNVHDIRGREIFNQSFQNTGLFNQNLELRNAQTGIYLVTVQDGERKEVQKIVIK